MAWLWQPYMTFILGMLALALWALAAPMVRDPRLRAAVAFVAAQPALLYAYALQGGVKELASAVIAATAGALGFDLVREPGRWRLIVPIGLMAVALLCVLNVGAVAYVAPMAGASGVAALAMRRRDGPRLALSRQRLLVAGGLAVALLAVAIPVISATSGFVAGGGILLKNKADLGNLFHPLDWKQVFGIWPSGDFRSGIGEGRTVAWVLIVVLGVAAVAGAALALRRRVLGPPIFAVTVVGAAIGLATFGDSPWVDAKTLAIASPAVALLGALGAAALLERRRLRILGGAALVAIAAGVLWSNWLAYRDVKLAPRDRLAELATVGERFAGQGPTLINEYEPYGARYFLRSMDPEAPAEFRRRVIPIRTGKGLGKNEWAPIDEFLLQPILVYRTIVLRRSPAESRPPAEYSLRWSGRYYDVWQRPEPPRARVLSYSIFGDLTNAAARPPCDLVKQLGSTARTGHAQLVGAVRAPAVIADLGAGQFPPQWPSSGSTPALLYPSEPGTARTTVTLPGQDVYDAWVQGSFARGLEVSIDGRKVGTTRDELSFSGQWIRFGDRRLTAGSHRVEVRYPIGSLRPGSGQQPETVGPVALVPRTPPPKLLRVGPARAATFCSQPLDWLEVVKR